MISNSLISKSWSFDQRLIDQLRTSTVNCAPDETVTGVGMAVIEIPMPSNAVNPTYERVVYLNNSDMDQDDVTIQAFAQCAKLVDVPPENVEEKGCYFY